MDVNIAVEGIELNLFQQQRQHIYIHVYIYIFIHNRPRGSHDTADIKVVGLQLVRYSYLVSDATLARQADRFVAVIISWCRPSTSQSLNRRPLDSRCLPSQER